MTTSGRPITEAVRHRPPLRLLRLLDRRLRRWKAPPDATSAVVERLSRILPVPGLAGRPSHWWLAPILSNNPDQLIAALRRKGYDATRGTTSMRAITDDAGRTPPQATRLIESVVYLPKPRNAAAATRLAAAVESALT